MDWTTLLRLPSTMLLVLAAIALLFTLVQLVAVRSRLDQGQPLAATGRGVLVLLAFSVTLVSAGAGWGLRGYRMLTEEQPVLDIDARILSPQQWLLTLHWPDGATRQVRLSGDAWRVEAVVLKWTAPVMFAHVPPFYRLDRLSGRYDDAAQEAQAPRTVVALDSHGSLDVVDLKRLHPGWIPGVDTVFGSGVFLPLVDQGHYSVSLMNTGALVARPDEVTEQRLQQPFGG